MGLKLKGSGKKIFLPPIKDPSQRDALARPRFSIIGPLLAAPPQAGELHTALGLLATKTWRHPSFGLDVSFGLSTRERWYDAARQADDPVAALKDRLRAGVKRFPSLAGHCGGFFAPVAGCVVGAMDDRNATAVSRSRWDLVFERFDQRRWCGGNTEFWPARMRWILKNEFQAAI